ncbi:MAG: hypothetical protein L3J20_04305 [Flavobacteriaceae bacterium]|nr:hypothetical protein [Flavobacteriaceae bacterium]
MKENNPTTENESSRLKRRKRKMLSPYKKGKYSISRLDEYEVYLNHIELLSKGGNLEIQ